MNSKYARLVGLEKLRDLLHQMIDQEVNAQACRIALGDQADDILSEEGSALPLAVPPAVFKGKKPISVILNGREIKTLTWKKLVSEILQDCAANPECYERMMALRGKVNGNFRPLLTASPDGMVAPIKIDDGLYWEGKFDTEALLHYVVTKLFDEVGYDYYGIVIRCDDAPSEFDEIVESENSLKEWLVSGLTMG